MGFDIAVGHCRDALQLGAAGILGVGHCRDALRLGTALRLRAVGEDNIDLKI